VQIAGLTILDRLVVTAHRAGIAPIFLVCETAPTLMRAKALGLRTTVVREIPTHDGVALLITGSVILEVSDLERVIEARGQLMARDGLPLPVKMIGCDPQPISAFAVATEVRDEASACEAEGKLWASFNSTADGLLDRFVNRPLGRPLSKLLVRTGVSPNQVSIISILIGVASAWFFARGDFVLGALVLQLSAIIDCVDGELARALLKQSRLGKWLDLGGDQVVHFSVFAALGLGVARMDPATPAFALGVSAAIGVLLSFAVVVRALRQPSAQRSPFLNRLLDATANRDFSVLLLILALIDRMELFLWLAGIGVHVFWVALLVLQLRPAMPAVSREPA